MPRAKLIRTAEFPYHIYNRSNNREFFYLQLDELWPIFLYCLEELKTRFGCVIHGFVLMGNHYHLLISTPQSNIGEAMKYFHREVARKANRALGRENHFFGGRYKWSVIGDEGYYWNAVKYIFRNPVRAGICNDVREYSFSSLNRRNDLEWNICDFFYDKSSSIELCAEWLNEPFLSEIDQAIKSGLRRREFKPSLSSNRRLIEFPAVHSRKGTVT